MIICFTGTGNTRRVADQLQAMLGDEILRLPPGLMAHPERAQINITGDRLIWTFPIHGWGLPKVVVDLLLYGRFLSNAPVQHYMVCTCGDDIGLSDRQWRNLVSERGFEAKGAFSVQMPNNYTFMRGFDVDSVPVAEAKLKAAVARVESIANAIECESDEVDVVPGQFPWIKSKIIYPWFTKYKANARGFASTEACVGCGKCSRNCPTNNIRMVNGQPRWGNTCVICSRCYHCCPQHAVSKGKATLGKGQYICPGYILNK